jgi:hypothetical protein
MNEFVVFAVITVLAIWESFLTKPFPDGLGKSICLAIDGTK